MKPVCSDIEGLWRAGARIDEIARLTGRSEGAVRKRIEMTCAGPSLPRKARAPRRCLCCGTEFMSAGPMNRLCGQCRKQSVTDLELWGGV